MATDDTTIVMRAPLFQAMGPDITQSIIQNRTARRYDRGERVFQQGDPAECFFLVVEGWVKLYRQREDGDEVVVAIFTAGETFAEVAMFMGGRYPATAEAVSPARILRIDGAALRRAVLQKPQLAFDMLAAASLHLKRLVQQIEQLKAQSAPQRIAEFLLDQVADAYGSATIALPYEKALIANRLGMQPESFSRALGRLRELGVTVERDNVHIKDLAKLIEFTRRSGEDDR
jgi:CRP-like cAMP-binding protein